MITTAGASEGVYFHRNGDYSGDIRIFIDSLSKDARVVPSVDGVEVIIPFEDLKTFVVGYVRSKKTERLENGSDDEVLGVT